MERYKDRYTLEQRIRQYKHVTSIDSEETRIPIICEPAVGSRFDTEETKTLKLLCPGDLTVAGLQVMIRKRVKSLKKTEAVYLLFGSDSSAIMGHSNQRISELHAALSDPDDHMLYVMYSLESTFG